MRAEPASFALLNATMIRRAARSDPEPERQATADAPSWRDDLRLFVFTWAAGFVFFLAFLA